MSSPHDALNLPQSLGNGLVLRLATPDDTEALAEFNTLIHLEEDEPRDFLRIWTRVLMSGDHPTTSAADFVVVENTEDHKIVSSTCLIPQVWVYDGIDFQVGRPELVGTDPAYRRQGLTRKIFDAIHTLSAAYGHQVQVVTGIPWFYRQFAYEYALALGGKRNLSIARVPELKKDETEPYQVRRATPADIPTLIRLYQRQTVDKLVTTPMDESRWRYELAYRNSFSHIYCLTDNQDHVIGSYIASAEVWGSEVAIWEAVVDEGVALHTALPTIMRALKAHGQRLLNGTKDKEGREKTLQNICFLLGGDHSAYEVFDAKLDTLHQPYGLYIRVPDLPGFIRHLAPAMEKRLAGSVMSGYSGELKITFYQGGLRLVFEQGRLTTAEDWQSPDDRKNRGGAGFPPLVFLKLLFGYRSLEELRYAFPDCWAEEEPTLLLKALFPKQASWIMPLG